MGMATVYCIRLPRANCLRRVQNDEGARTLLEDYGPFLSACVVAGPLWRWLPGVLSSPLLNPGHHVHHAAAVAERLRRDVELVEHREVEVGQWCSFGRPEMAIALDAVALAVHDDRR